MKDYCNSMVLQLKAKNTEVVVFLKWVTRTDSKVVADNKVLEQVDDKYLTFLCGAS